MDKKFACKHQGVPPCYLLGKPCDCHNCEENCSFAHNIYGDTMPTFRQAIDIYKSSGVAKDMRMYVVENCILNSLKDLGLSEDDKLSEMSYERFEELIAKLKDPKRKRGTCRSHTISTYLSAFGAITSPRLVRLFAKQGLQLYVFDKPQIEANSVKQTISEEQARIVKVGMEKWFASGKPSDVKAALFTFFGLYMQMRAGDICNLKWGNIVQTVYGVMLSYVPSKTDNDSHTGEGVSFIIDPEDFYIIKPYIGKPDEYVIPREDKYIPKSMKPGRCNYHGYHKYTRLKVNKLWSLAGVGNDYRGQKRSHAGRKFRETVNAHKFGKKEALRRSCHSERVGDKYYIGSLRSLAGADAQPLVA